MSAVERIAKGYQPDFDIDYKIGHQGELFIASVLDSLEDGARIEVKNDQRAAETGNFYLEYSCFVSGQWVSSGVARKTAESAEVMSLIVGNSVVVSAPRNLVAAVAADYWMRGAQYRKECMRGSHPTKGVIVPIGQLVSEIMQAGKRLGF